MGHDSSSERFALGGLHETHHRKYGTHCTSDLLQVVKLFGVPYSVTFLHALQVVTEATGISSSVTSPEEPGVH